MNKAIIVEVNSRHLIVLAEGGEFKKIKHTNPNHQVGQEITIPLNRNPRSFTSVAFNWKTGFAVALAIILLFFQIFSPISNQGAYAYVGMDMDPSLELKINEKMQVLNIISFNEEGKNVLNQLKHWKKKEISVVTNDIFEISKKLGYLEKNEEVLITTTLSEDIPKEKEQEMKERVNEVMNRTAKEKSVEMTTIVISSKERKKAKEMKISPGQYAIYSAAKKSGMNITKSEISGKTIEEITEKVGSIKDLLAGNNEPAAANNMKSNHVYEPPLPILDEKEVVVVNDENNKMGNQAPARTEKQNLTIPAVAASPKIEHESSYGGERQDKEKETPITVTDKTLEKDVPVAQPEKPKPLDEKPKQEKPKVDVPKEVVKETPKVEPNTPVTEPKPKDVSNSPPSENEEEKWINVEIIVDGNVIVVQIKADSHLLNEELKKRASELLNQNILTFNQATVEKQKGSESDCYLIHENKSDQTDCIQTSETMETNQVA